MMNKHLSFIDVSHEVTKADGSNDGIWYFKDRLNLKEDLIIGFSPTNYHCFIVSGEQEFHARFSINPCKVQPSRKDNVRAALFFRFKGLPQADLERFQEFLLKMKNKRTPSCHVGLLQVLSIGLGLTIPTTKLEKATPKSFLKSLWERGLIDQNGNAVPYEVYSSRTKSPAAIMKDIDYIELRYSWVFWLSRLHFFFLKLYSPSLIVRREV